MKQKEKDDLEMMYGLYNNLCFFCWKRATQRAHILGNTKLNRKLYGDEVIDSPLNWIPVCGLEHNKMADIGTIQSYQQKVADIISSNMSDVEKREEIENIVLARLNERVLK